MPHLHAWQRTTCRHLAASFEKTRTRGIWWQTTVKAAQVSFAGYIFATRGAVLLTTPSKRAGLVRVAVGNGPCGASVWLMAYQ